MNEIMRILIAEDNQIAADVMEHALRREGYQTVVAHDGREAIERLKLERFDALVTDWMMPNVDGITLIRKARSIPGQTPLIIMVTAMDTDRAHEYALTAGADDYITKPLRASQLVESIRTGFQRRGQIYVPLTVFEPLQDAPEPPFVVTVMAGSTGSVLSIYSFFQQMKNIRNSAVLVVVHGKDWFLKGLTERLAQHTAMPVKQVREGMPVRPGEVYVAAGNAHMLIDRNTFTITLDSGPEVNHVKPAADPLFISAAEAFGKYCVGVVFSGLGCDGTAGAARIAAAGGTVLVQDPKTALAPSMPLSVVNAGVKHSAAPVDSLAGIAEHHIKKLFSQLAN